MESCDWNFQGIETRSDVDPFRLMRSWLVLALSSCGSFTRCPMVLVNFSSVSAQNFGYTLMCVFSYRVDNLFL